ncbi:MAG: DUF86 domain-containing protein [Thermodesulfobacterium sp.]|nr:DUF86 domain-containing protein [Thermodesulfobacterium sp.]
MRDIKLYVKDILDAINAIERFVEGMNFESFKEDDKTSSAVIRKFEIIGEAAKNIPQSIKKQYPHIPWKEMAGFRDKFIHFYFGIEYGIVWNTIKLRLPKLKKDIETILKDLLKEEQK